MRGKTIVVRAAVVAVAAVVLTGTAAHADPVTPASPVGEQRHPTGIALLGPADLRPLALTPEVGQAYFDAFTLARKHPDAFGYPWVDRTTGTVVMQPTNATGSSLTRDVLAKHAGRATTRAASRTFRQLEAIKDDATTLVEAGLPDADSIFKTEPDGEHNRVVVTVTRLSDRLLASLAKRYGTDAVAVRVEEAHEPVGASFGRDADNSAFYGGAQIYVPVGTCTSGFSWVSGSTFFMVSAGHCARNGGSVSTPVSSMGTVTADSRENWSPTTGTTYLSGQQTYRGDLSLIEIESGKSSAGFIYRGGPGSTSTGPVKEMWSRSPATGDQYCTGGFKTGEMCGWVTDAVAVNIKYDADGPNVWARNVNEGNKQGQCIIHGDSGGPVYTVRSDGGIAAKGINSGSGGGGSDNWGGAFDPCYHYYTDIWQAWQGFPGVLKVV